MRRGCTTVITLQTRSVEVISRTQHTFLQLKNPNTVHKHHNFYRALLPRNTNPLPKTAIAFPLRSVVLTKWSRWSLRRSYRTDRHSKRCEPSIKKSPAVLAAFMVRRANKWNNVIGLPITQIEMIILGISLQPVSLNGGPAPKRRSSSKARRGVYSVKKTSIFAVDSMSK